MITEVLIALGLKKAPEVSLLSRHIIEFTHSSWLQGLYNNNTVRDYEYNLWS